MASAEGVVLALGALEEAGDAALLTQRLHAITTAGEQLVRVTLVSDIPDQLIEGRVEHVMQCHRQLDDAKSGADVPTRAGARVNELVANLARERSQLIAREGLQVGG